MSEVKDSNTFVRDTILLKFIIFNVPRILRDEESRIQTKRNEAQRSGRSITWDTYYRHDEVIFILLMHIQL